MQQVTVSILFYYGWVWWMLPPAPPPTLLHVSLHTPDAKQIFVSRVADPDPGSRAFLSPGSRMEKYLDPGSGTSRVIFPRAW
jgi:hypothetical protein